MPVDLAGDEWIAMVIECAGDLVGEIWWLNGLLWPSDANGSVVNWRFHWKVLTFWLLFNSISFDFSIDSVWVRYVIQPQPLSPIIWKKFDFRIWSHIWMGVDELIFGSHWIRVTFFCWLKRKKLWALFQGVCVHCPQSKYVRINAAGSLLEIWSAECWIGRDEAVDRVLFPIEGN